MKSFRPVDQFELHCSDEAPRYISNEELRQLAGSILVYDIECFRNFFFLAFRNIETQSVVTFELDNTHALDLPKLAWVLKSFALVGFNSLNYDILLLLLALKGASVEALFKASCEIILDELRAYAFEKKYKVKREGIDHIDLIEVAPLQGSLKLYAGRLHTKRMQNLPVDPQAALTEEEKSKTKAYCINDLVSTELLYRELEPQIELRKQMSAQYRVDLRSKSDAQIAEAVIASELSKVCGAKVERPQVDPNREYFYHVPEYVRYRSPVLQEMLETVRQAHFVCGPCGYVDMPPEIEKLKIELGGCVYRMGLGGLHSSEESVVHIADEDTLILDRDVTSYYPSIILNQRLYPLHLGIPFLSVYKSIVERRIEAKANGNKIVADSLKITINGSFGKLGSKWSVLYSPDLMIQVTLTGQLSLLLLIEMIEDLGIPVVSANTDGVMVKCPRSRLDDLQDRVAWWEGLTGFQTEETRYRAVYVRDVNNYIALKADGGKPKARFLDERLGCKVKGCYAERGSAANSVLSKNPENLVCMDAVLSLIANGTPLEETIHKCGDIRRFVTVRNVSGGAQKSGVHLGKVIRWYYSTEMKGEINRATKGDKIPNSDGARPLMQLPADFPVDIDYDRYVEVARSMLYDLGYYKGTYKQITGSIGPLFD